MPGSWFNLYGLPAGVGSDLRAPVWPVICGALTLAALASGLVEPQSEDARVTDRQAAAVASRQSRAGLQPPNLIFKIKRSAPDHTAGNQKDEELVCLALNIYFEARGEPAIGKLAVGHVVMNRVEAHDFPGSICGVVQQGGYRLRHRCQFSWWCDGKSDQPRHAAAWDESLLLARKILSGESADPTAGAMWYHADYVSPHWKNALKRGPTLGRHVFYLKEGRT